MAIGDTAGIHDPYWYEDSVGLLHIIDMLNPDKGIKSVTLQKRGTKGLDDVVIEYHNDHLTMIQVKHTRVGDTLTFGNLVSSSADDNSGLNGCSLLSHIAKAWLDEHKKHRSIEARIFTNQISGSRGYGDRPALNLFWEHLQNQLDGANALSDIEIPSEWETSWQEWASQLDCLRDDSLKLSFLRAFHIDTNQDDLDAIHLQLLSRLHEALGVTREQAEELLKHFYSALRVWTTSIRQEDAITPEVVWKEIGAETTTVGVHGFPPPTPFFPSRIAFQDELESRVLNSSKPVVFLAGDPGSGKTSIISSIANSSSQLIDLRYHAFRPISPGMIDLSLDTGRSATAEALWSDLLIQMKKHLVGQLAHYRVPLRSNILSTDECRAHVLRLASQLATERGRDFVIAIDGIDHAARVSSAGRLPFLNSLPGPDEIPAGVRLLLVGQPPESWPAYPYWLREDNDGVDFLQIPSLSEADINALVAHRRPDLESNIQNSFTRVIARITSCNTLSVVFAVEEAVGLDNPINLYQRLRSRQLSTSLRNYYDGIWQSAIKKIPDQYFAHKERIAACVTLSREHLTGLLLSNVFRNDAVSPEQWNEVLRNLRPLLVEEALGFRVLHNDVRVHLALQAGSDKSRLHETALLLIEYYESDSSGADSRHSNLFEVARLANELNRASHAFTPYWVAEAAALNRSQKELQDQAKLALQGLEVETDWHVIHSVVCGLNSLQQLEMSDSWMGRKERCFQEEPLLISECEVTPGDKWDIEVLTQVIEDAEHLVPNDPERARGLLSRWFKGLSSEAMFLLLCDNHKRKFPRSPGFNSHQCEDLFYRWGSLSQQLSIIPRAGRLHDGWGHEEQRHTNIRELDYPESKPDEMISPPDLNSDLDYLRRCFGSAVLVQASLTTSGFEWVRCVRSIQAVRCRQSDMISVLDNLAERGLWFEVVYLLRKLNPDATLLPALRAKCMILAIVTQHQYTVTKWTSSNVDSNIDWKWFKGSSGASLLAICAFAFARAWKKPQEQSTYIRDIFMDIHYRIENDERSKRLTSTLIRASAIAGRTWKQSAEDSIPLDENSVEELSSMLTRILEPEYNHPIEFPYDYWSIASLLFQLMLEALAKNEVFHDRLAEIVLKNASRFEMYPTAEHTWRFCVQERRYDILSHWWEHWCGDSGEAWVLSLSERFDIVKRLANLARETGWRCEADNVLTRLNWTRIGYSDHKEYSLEGPLGWFQTLSRREPSVWRETGLDLLSVSHHVSLIGDNRLSMHVQAAIADAMAKEGISAAESLANASSTGASVDWFQPDSHMFCHWLLQCTASDDLTQSDLLCIWSLGTGILWWEDSSEYASIADLRDCILERAKRSGFTDLELKLEELAPLEFASPASTEAWKRHLWIHDIDRGTDARKEDPEKVVSQVLQNVRSGLATKDDIKQASIHFQSCSSRHTKNDVASWQLLKAWLTLRDRRYVSWTYDGTETVIAPLIPYVGDTALLELVHNLVTENSNFTQKYYLSGLASNLGFICRHRGETLTTDDLYKFTNRELGMHLLWAHGYGHLPEVNKPKLSQLQESKDNWQEFSVKILSELLHSEDKIAVRSALQGMYSLAELESPLPFIKLAMADSSWPDIRYWWLLICERLALDCPHLRTLIHPSVAPLVNDSSIQVALQAWLTQALLHLAKGESLPKWPYPKPGTSYPATSPKFPGLILPSDSSQGSINFITEQKQVVNTIKRLSYATGIDLSDLEARAASRNREPSPPRSHSSFKGSSSTIRFTDHGLLNVFFDELHRDMCFGRFKGVSPVKCAQGMLWSDEPKIMLRTFPRYSGSDWPLEEPMYPITEEMLPGVWKKLEHILLEEDIGDSEVVIGGRIVTYDYQADYVIDYSLVWTTYPLFNDSFWHRLSLSERGFQYTLGDATLPPDRDWIKPFVFQARGVAEFPSSGFDIVPGSIWYDLGWRTEGINSFKWRTPSGHSVRFELLYGPTRSEPQDAYYRQPYLQRWVSQVQAVKEVKNELGGDVVLRMKNYKLPYRKRE